MQKSVVLVLALGLASVAAMAADAPTAQSVDDTQLKQIILVGRHGVRSPTLPNSTLNAFSTQPFPVFSTTGGNLTDNGRQIEILLGGYYRSWLTKEGLLTGSDSADAAFVHFRANGFPLIIETAQAFWAGMLPGANITVSFHGAPDVDPLFNPVGAGVARLDEHMAVAAVMGRVGGNPQGLAAAYAPELALTRSILFGYPAGTTPAPATPSGKVDVTAIPFTAAVGSVSLPVDLGGLTTINGAIDPFVFEYADGLPLSDVGWGKLNADGISQITRLLTLALDLEFRTPYLSRVQSSNLASHVVRSMLQAATGNAMTGTVGTPSTKVIVLMAANTNVTGLAGLFQMDWVLPGYQPDYCAPSGILAFELRQSQSTGEYIVRTSYMAPSMDQMRNRTVLTPTAPPATVPVLIPGCGVRKGSMDCPLTSFVKVAKQAIDAKAVDLEN